MIQAEPTLAKLGFRISPRRAGGHGARTLSPTLSAAGLWPWALPAGWLSPGLGTSRRGGGVGREPIGKALPDCPPGDIPTAFGQK